MWACVCGRQATGVLKKQAAGLAAELGLAGTELPQAKWLSKAQLSKAQPTCEVRHIAAVLKWAADSSLGTVVQSQEERDALVQRVQGEVRDIVQKRLVGLREAMEGSLGLAVDAVDPLVTKLREELEQKCINLRNEVRATEKLLQADERKLQDTERALQEARATITALQEKSNMPALVVDYLRVSAAEQLKHPETTGLAVPVAFTVHMPVEGANGVAQYKHFGGVLQEEATGEDSMLCLEALMSELFLHVTRRVGLENDEECSTKDDVVNSAKAKAVAPLHRILRARITGTRRLPTDAQLCDGDRRSRKLVVPWQHASWNQTPGCLA